MILSHTPLPTKTSLTSIQIPQELHLVIIPWLYKSTANNFRGKQNSIIFFMLKAKSNKSDPYYSTITNFYGCNLHYFMAKNKSKDELLIKLIFGESNKITLGQNQNQIKSTLFLSFYSSTITNFYGKQYA